MPSNNRSVLLAGHFGFMFTSQAENKQCVFEKFPGTYEQFINHLSFEK